MTTSLVIVTPFPGPCFIDEAKLKKYPSLNTHIHVHTHTDLDPSVKATGDCFSISGGKRQIPYKSMCLDVEQHKLLLVWKINRADDVHSSVVYFSVCRPHSQARIQNLTPPDLLGRLWMAGQDERGAKCVTAMSSELFMASMTLTFSRMLQFISFSAELSLKHTHTHAHPHTH